MKEIIKANLKKILLMVVPILQEEVLLIISKELFLKNMVADIDLNKIKTLKFLNGLKKWNIRK